MNRRDRVKRYLAMLLAFAMIFQQAGITTIADETEAVVAQQSEAAETKMQAVPETSAPETKAPETQAPETKAPETKAPETQAPETKAPETKAPETQAPETSAPETKAPETPATEAQGISEAVPETQASEKNETTVTETQASETNAPETDAPETQVTEATESETAATEGETEAKETETETESETETEAPKTNHFAASFANGKADVTLSEAISEKAQFIAEQKSEESAYFDDALNIVGPWLDAKGLTILDAAVYDMHFEEDGKEIAVNQKANVNIQFASPILTMEPETGIQTQVYVLHIVNGNVEDAGSVTRNGAGAVTAASIHTNGFSPFVFVKVASGEPVVIPNGPIDLSNALYNAAISQVTYGGKTEAFDPNKQYPRDAKFTFELKYAFAENNKPTASGVRTAVYELPSCLSVVNATGTIECPGYAGSAGTYEIKNGVVTFVYEEAFLKAHPSDIKGTFNFEGALSNSATENKEEVEIDFNGSGTTIPITVKFEDGKVTGDKTCTLNADGTIDFTIRLKVTEKDVKNLVLTDTQGSNLEFANPPEFRLDGKLLNPGQYTVSGNQMTLNLGDRTRGEYTLTYKARIKDLNIKDGDHNKNRADWTWNGGSGTKDTTVQITESLVDKKGSVSNGEITWTVIYVPGNLSPAAGKTFTDTLGADQEYTGNYEVYYDSNGSQWWVGGQQIASGALSDITAADGKSFSYTFPSDQTANRGAYKLVYKTKITKDMSDIKDTVTFTNKINGDGKEADGKVEVKPGEKPKPDIVKKSVVTDSENRKATWTITVTPPEGKTVKNLVIKDELQDFYIWKGKYEGTVTVKEAGSTLMEGKDYTVATTAGGNGVNPTMTLVFSKKISGVLEITYTSDYTDSGSRSGWVGNKIHSSYTIDDEDNEEDDKASGEIKNTDFVLDKSGTLSGGIAKWEIIINDLQNWKRTDLPENTKTITDTLPERMVYVDGSAKCMLYKENEENNPKETAITASFDSSTRKLTMTVPALTGKVRAVITYDTRITEIPSKSGNGVTVKGDKISFTNSVTVGKKTESATVTMTSKELHKAGKAVSGLKNVVEYVIDVNYEAIDLLPDSDVLVLEDILDENLTLDTTSIKVTDRDTGEAVSFKRSFSTLNDGKTKMVLTIPDSRALRVVYRATLVTAGKEDGKTYQVSNSATLKGQAEKSTEIKTEVKYQKSDATVSGGSDSVSIQKVNEDGKSLKGATFVVRAVNPETLEDNPAYETMTATSDSNGMVTFEKLHYNTLYYYEETTAPTGYSRDTEKHYFIIKNIKDDAKKKEYEELKGKADEKNITLNEFTGGNTVIFENRKETTSLMVRKEWIQEDDIPADASVQVQLFGKAKDGAETQYGDTATLSAENGWRYTWEDLPITDSNGNEITYSVKEVGESDGKVTISGNKFAVEIEDLGKEGFIIANKKLIDISGSKTWDDNNNQDGKRPGKIVINLLADGTKVASKEVTAANNWSWSFTDLPKYKDAGTKIEYTITEDAVENYMTVVDGYNVTNMHIPATINISGGKHWDDANNQDGKRPGSITIRLYADGTELTDKVQTVTAADNWEWTFTNLPKYANGTEINYTITEDAVADYTTSVRGYNVTNTYTPEVVRVVIRKVWDDENNQDGKRPTELKVDLKKKVGNSWNAPNELVQTITLNEGNGWIMAIENLPKYADGKEILYNWSEHTAGLEEKGYYFDSIVTEGEITTLTNIYAPGKVSASVKKVWNDGGNQDGIRPETLRVNLLKNGQATDQFVILSEENRWSATLDNLDEYTDGTLNEYTWSEELPNGYTVTVSDPDEMGITTLANTHTPATIKASVEKTWEDNGDQDGKRPEKLLVTLMRRIREQAVPISLDDADTNPAEEVKTVELTAANDWKASEPNLPKYKDGQMYEYFWTEKEGNIPDGYKLTNEVTYNILSPGEGVTGFITTLTNTHTPEVVNATIRKTWNDSDNQDGVRPTEIKVDLKKNGQVIQTVTLDTANGWETTVKDLPKYTAGVENIYSWSEQTDGLPEGYTVTVSDPDEMGITTLTNTHTPAMIEASVKKTWDDNDDQDGKRPEKLFVTLMRRIREQAVPMSLDDADDADTNPAEEVKTVELTAANDWKASEPNLPKYKDGQMYEYFWTEKEGNIPDGYKLTNEVTYNILSPGEGVTGFITTLTNTHTPQKINAVVKKVWDDNNNQDGKRAHELTVELMRNGTKVAGTGTLNEENGWTGTVENLDKYTGGVKNVYTWVEKDLPEGYSLTDTKKEVTEATENTLEADITTLTNSYTPGKVEASVLKVWNDEENQDGIRPGEITVILVKNDEPTTQSVTLSEANHWTAAITGLDEYTDGILNEYTWKEAEALDGYTLTNTKKEGRLTTLTNTHTPAMIEASVKKTWDDNDDQDGKRPEKLFVTLMRRIREQAVPISLDDTDDADTNPAEEVKTVELTAANGWKKSVPDIPKYTNGQEYEYFWTEKNENIPEGYKLTSEVTGNTVTEGKGVTAIITSLTNTHTPETTDISVTKVWEDNNNKADVRPVSIQVQLYAGETSQGDPVELNETNGWKYTWANLDKYAAGEQVDYRVDEVGETDGYLKSVASNEDKTEYVITNTITSVKITKVDISDAHELEGAHLQILDSNGTVVAEWDSAKEEHEVTGLKTGELYTLRETVAPDGYTITTDTTFELDEHGKLKEDKTTTKTKDGVLLVEDTATSVKVRKVDITNAEELPGAHIQIWEKTDEGEKLVTEWESTKEDKVVEKLKTNTTYILRETVAPDGYTITTDTTFELDEHGKLKKDKTTTNTKDGVLLVEDARTVEVSKVDLGTGEELDGAHIQVLDKAGNVVDEWDSKKGETQKVKNFKVGQEYTLRETVAPNGYTLTTDTTFTIDRTGKVTGTVTINKDGVLLVEDTATKAEITKLDAATEAPLSGAVLRVIDANGTAVDEWTTDGQPHVIEAKLNTGATYQLIEVKAPDGYEIAEPISFTMKADGTTDPVVMKDAMTRSEKASVSVTKKLTFSGEEISAVDATFYVALYADEACTKRISEIMPLVFKKASSATVTFTNVEIGRTYYVGECDANGVNFVSGVMAGNVAYAAVFANGNKATVTEADGSTTVYFENQFATIPDGFYKEGILTITKKLLGSDKKAKNSNEVFYAGIFSDAAYTQLSGDVSENIVALDLAGGSEAEAEVFVAIAPGGSQTLYVTEVDANGKPVAGAAGFKYTVQVDKTSVTLSEANAEAHVTITNTETETETESETKKTTSVKTGDDTPIAPYMALMLASMAMLAAEFICRRKRRSKK